jgi:dCMP deaminase
MNIWDQRFLKMAGLVASWSKDPSTQVGAVIVDVERRVLSLGYNGFPKGISDDKRLDNRETKYKMVVHAECNALLFASKSLVGCTMYTYPFMPCSSCAGMIIQSGITRVVSRKTFKHRWEDNFEVSRDMFKEANVKLYEI